MCLSALTQLYVYISIGIISSTIRFFGATRIHQLLTRGRSLTAPIAHSAWTVSRWAYLNALSSSSQRFIHTSMSSSPDSHNRGMASAEYSGVASSSSPKRQDNTQVFRESAKRDCEVLDRTIFDKTLHLVALRIPAKLCTEYLKVLKDIVFSRSRMKRIFNDDGGSDGKGKGNKDKRLILLNPDISMEHFKGAAGGSGEPSTLLTQHHLDFCSQNGGEPVPFDLKLGYDNLAVDEVLKKLLPAGSEVPSSFEQVGHVAHINIREELLPYKAIIGQVLLEKNAPQIKTVVNKVGEITNEFRTFPMEVVAGVDDLQVTLKESGAQFSFNFAEVYWNSRLQMEHKRIIDLIRTSAATSARSGRVLVVADLMAGVGPFAVPLAMKPPQAKPAAKKGKYSFTENREEDQVQQQQQQQQQQKKKNNKNSKSSSTETAAVMVQVHANDLNPKSVEALVQNAVLNKIKHIQLIRTDDYSKSESDSSSSNCSSELVALHVYNQCGRAFLRNLAIRDKQLPQEVLMNLPANATDFLDAMIGIGVLAGLDKIDDPANTRDHIMPRVHVYGFSTAEDPVLDMAQRACTTMGCKVSDLGERSTDSSNVASREKNTWAGHQVRDVAPKKLMICLSFYLPHCVAFADPPAEVTVTNSRSKRKRGGEQGVN